MKALSFKIPKTQNAGVVYQEDIMYKFYDKFHQHEEIQISGIIKGKGTLIVGDTVHNYNESDVFVIGSNLPHVFKSDLEYEDKSLMLTLFFTKSSFGKDFFSLNDFKELSAFFDKILNGFKVVSENKMIIDAFLQLREASSLDRFIGLFSILKLLNKTDSKPLAEFVYPRKYNDNHGKRMQTIINYTITHFNSTIDLQVIADKANMSRNAFCRYFKQRTNKTYFTFLNELRIENACKLLEKNKEMPVNEIAFKCGFNSLSNFNRKFMEVKKITPSGYRK